MTRSQQISVGAQARLKLFQGIVKVSQAPSPLFSKLHTQDPCVQLGINMAREVMMDLHNRYGDGAYLFLALVSSLVDAGLKAPSTACLSTMSCDLMKHLPSHAHPVTHSEDELNTVVNKASDHPLIREVVRKAAHHPLAYPLCFETDHIDVADLNIVEGIVLPHMPLKDILLPHEIVPEHVLWCRDEIHSLYTLLPWLPCQKPWVVCAPQFSPHVLASIRCHHHCYPIQTPYVPEPSPQPIQRILISPSRIIMVRKGCGRPITLIQLRKVDPPLRWAEAALQQGVTRGITSLAQAALAMTAQSETAWVIQACTRLATTEPSELTPLPVLQDCWSSSVRLAHKILNTSSVLSDQLSESVSGQ